MKDIHNFSPQHKIEISEVGIQNYRIPLIFDMGHKISQRTVGEVSLAVNLSGQYRGVHMSRFVEIINKYSSQTLSVTILNKLAHELLKLVEANNCAIRIKFPLFISRLSPISQKKSPIDYQCQLISSVLGGKDKVIHVLEVRIPISTVCPCSKLMSKYGAHNQRGFVTVILKINDFTWIEKIIKLVEQEASSPVYSLLKRADEKYVTEKAYENPKFVEDIVRDIASRLQSDKQINWIKIKCENSESIHNHDVFACIERKNVHNIKS